MSRKNCKALMRDIHDCASFDNAFIFRHASNCVTYSLALPKTRFRQIDGNDSQRENLAGAIFRQLRKQLCKSEAVIGRIKKGANGKKSCHPLIEMQMT